MPLPVILSSLRDNIRADKGAFSVRVGIIELLLDAGAEIEALDNYGSTPLDEAKAKDQTGAIELLIGSGAAQ